VELINYAVMPESVHHLKKNCSN